METNIGATDRSVRLVVGGALAVLGLAAVASVVAVGSTVGTLALLAGVILVGTALLRTCPIYRILGMSTCPAQ